MFTSKNKQESQKKKSKSFLSKILKILKWIGITIVSLILLILLVRVIGKGINNSTPSGGINESRYVEINNSTQWINIYGKNTNNPVILYLHGGPGGASSMLDYKSLRKWSDVYTVVTWDQRDSGLSLKKGVSDANYTQELFMKDGVEMTKYLLNYLHKEKIILIGHSWGSYFGSNLALQYPEYYQYYIGTGQEIDFNQSELALIEAGKVWSKNDKEGQELVSIMEKHVNNKNTMEYFNARDKLMSRYLPMDESPDYNAFFAGFFNPYYSILEIFSIISYSNENVDKKYLEFISGPEFEKFSLLNKTEYQIPYYNINGDLDYQTNYQQSKEYFDVVKAPRKKFYTMKDMAHGLFLIRTEEFSKYMHEIAKLEQQSSNTTTTTTTNTNTINTNANTNTNSTTTN